MAKVVVYSGPNCPYCVHVKAILTKKGIPFEEFDVRADAEKLAEMMEVTSGKRSIPQITVNGKYIGDDDDIDALVAAGRLEEVMAG